ncbi:MAG: hypothetical protein HC877_24350 [Thioploca sp.]|nr:hypothetical protein [Thioploca sp.]
MSKINWHRLFGLTLIDFVTDSNYHVELEQEVSLKKQYLDIVIIKQHPGRPLTPIPDGLEQLSRYNLLTYKSLREPLDEWAIEELIGYYTNYRKLVSSSPALLPTKQFQLYAISTRYPQQLLSQKLACQALQPGVFDLTWGTRLIRLIVLSQIALTVHNALWLLFSGQEHGFVYGDRHYQWHQPSERAVLNQLYQLYQHEGVVMPYTMVDFEKDFTKEHLHLLLPEERLQGLPPEERLQGLPPEERLKGLPPEERLKGLPPETLLKQLSLEERFQGLSPEVIEAYLSKLKNHLD